MINWATKQKAQAAAAAAAKFAFGNNPPFAKSRPRYINPRRLSTTTPISSHLPIPKQPNKQKMADTKTLLEAVEARRTYYQLTNESPIPDSRIKELVAHAVKHVPSAFNSQTTRLVVVLRERHAELWDAVMEVYKVQLPGDKFEHAKGRMVGFRKAYGTVRAGFSLLLLLLLFCK